MARKPKGSIDTAMAGKVKGITPEMLAASGSEHGHQCAIFQWLALGQNQSATMKVIQAMAFAVPNGGAREAHVGAAMRAEGVKPGIPDIVLPLRRSGYGGLWVELKLPGREREKAGGRSPAQVTWHERLAREGYAVVLAYGWQAACWALVAYECSRLVMGTDGDAIIGLPVDTPPDYGDG